ncbi:MAG: Asp-tRNA(Asn)/Glu-tRNA(Gln) amidotransferase subunit GatC [Magnetococcales bacterium]|nr:Asp-tRNA(Asn)/Glu-tRNA(Gln) amidotransferase subunit GatC [Magnetococcales bacterium]MBF0151282.1 Asp-tRNA(Asn)/Glu-tRNA(Gln) amidotransferase subunit GatC [Magnetococcales bacterium]MBF0174864.1 Asp-tRNA(Asn)/Glu-tRNA(Gln) amidotransferase subunit GatC [Magnetococcales bacterium]MBF0347361.1 Asp-tRNA(Asn)/Glu-tRNA(Gln) amidotransferase subunit GatC [Magnetococcales bacterium]MBF0631630.1 Asp-tRNA(Asn)/Glu-tRNA(Gln) amidotransferase subunit GatC [Magnetococcales bacterium]
MSIQAETVKQVAVLARLQLDDQAVPPLVEQLSNILKLVEQLNELDTRDVVPMSHALDMPIPERPDEVVNTNCKDALLANAPDSVQGYFQVPKIIE